jgi:hypothetical protein
MSAALRGTVVLAVTGILAAQQPHSIDPPAFETVLWLHGGPARDAAFFANVREAGYTAVSVTGGEDPAAPGQHGLRFYRDQLAGKGELELRDAQWDPWWTKWFGSRDDAALVRPTCLLDPAVRARMLEKIDAALASALPHAPFAASIADEPSSTRGVNPLDVCFSEHFLSAYRADLARRFASVDAMNERFGTAFLSFESVQPMSTRAIRRRELGASTLPRNLAPWNDQLAFTDRAFVDLVAAATQRCAEKAPGLPVGLTGLPAPSAFGGFDYQHLLVGQRFYEVYDDGGVGALARSRAEADAREFITLFPLREAESPRLIEARLADALAHGVSGAIVWSSGDCFRADGTATRFGAALTGAFARFAPIAARCAGARVIPSPIWIVESRASVRARWMLDSIADGDTWPKRFTSHETAHGTSMRGRESFVDLLRDLGLQPHFVFADELPARLRAQPPRVLLLHDLLAIADAEASAIRTYVEGGGHVVADHGVGVYDESLVLRTRGALDDLFGIESRSLERADWLLRDARGRDGSRTGGGLAIAERGLRGKLAERLETADVQLESRHGAGRAVLLNLGVGEYAAMRNDPASFVPARELRARLRQVLRAAELHPPALVRGEGLPTVIERVVLRARDGTNLLALRVAALDQPAVLAELESRGDLRVELVFPTAVRLRDLWTGESIAATPSCTVALNAWRGAFFEVREER